MHCNIHTFGGFSLLLQHSHTTNLNPNPSGGDHEVKGRVVEQKTVNLLNYGMANQSTVNVTFQKDSLSFLQMLSDSPIETFRKAALTIDLIHHPISNHFGSCSQHDI